MVIMNLLLVGSLKESRNKMETLLTAKEARLISDKNKSIINEEIYKELMSKINKEIESSIDKCFYNISLNLRDIVADFEISVVKSLVENYKKSGYDCNFNVVESNHYGKGVYLNVSWINNEEKNLL